MGKHIYCAKPMTRTIAEARRVKGSVPCIERDDQGEHSGLVHVAGAGDHRVVVVRGDWAGKGGALLDGDA